MSHDLIDEVPPIFLQLYEYEHIVTSPSLTGELYTGPLETVEARMALGALPKLVHAIDRAKSNSNLALSWRNYNVGSSAVMCNFETGRIGFLDGYNVKPSENDSSLNLHAEQIAIAKGRYHGLNKVIGITVYADPINDDANPNGHPTLRPCGRCTDMFTEIPEVDERTLVLGSNQDMSICELYTVGSLLDPSTPKLVDRTFSLQSEDDLQHYDREINPYLIHPIFNMFGVKIS